ncbi:MAG: hypothetical protein JEZ14_15045 [Marinilabiliaceae bacterium]|nr:hypothetical protein [Marinilabiliaceae bacterium]
MLIKKLIYGKNYIYLAIQDCILKFFQNTDCIDNEIFYKDSHLLYEFDNVIENLIKEEYIEQTSRCVKITLSGKIKAKSGGFLREAFRKRMARVGIAIGVIAGLLTILSYFKLQLYSF